jgi:hypothetical protein
VFEVRPRQNCPGMVGPMEDGIFYCRGKEFGYCDRRSGICLCNVGYQGVQCEECTPSHVERGGLCYPKRHCPNDCSGGGQCNYFTAECECSPHRKGLDCSELVCEGFDALCDQCTAKECTRCAAGYSVHHPNRTEALDPLLDDEAQYSFKYLSTLAAPEEGANVTVSIHQDRVCRPCVRFDPRCSVCTTNKCVQCMDPLLNSVRR